MMGEQLSEVIKTRNGEYPLGTLVLCKAGWVSHYISNGEGLSPISFDIGSTSISHTLGALGMPGYLIKTFLNFFLFYLIFELIIELLLILDWKNVIQNQGK